MRNIISTLLRRHLVASEGHLSSCSMAVNKIEKKILFVNKKMNENFETGHTTCSILVCCAVPP